MVQRSLNFHGRPKNIVDDDQQKFLPGISTRLVRKGFESKKVQDIQNIYRILYQKKYNNTQAMEIIQAELNATPERDEIIQFIENSQRGIMKGYFQKN